MNFLSNTFLPFLPNSFSFLDGTKVALHQITHFIYVFIADSLLDSKDVIIRFYMFLITTKGYFTNLAEGRWRSCQGQFLNLFLSFLRILLKLKSFQNLFLKFCFFIPTITGIIGLDIDKIYLIIRKDKTWSKRFSVFQEDWSNRLWRFCWTMFSLWLLNRSCEVNNHRRIVAVSAKALHREYILVFCDCLTFWHWNYISSKILIYLFNK